VFTSLGICVDPTLFFIHWFFFAFFLSALLTPVTPTPKDPTKTPFQGPVSTNQGAKLQKIFETTKYFGKKMYFFLLFFLKLFPAASKTKFFTSGISRKFQSPIFPFLQHTD